jgi:hypothetical protein
VRVPGQFPLTILVGLAACTWLLVAAGLYGAEAEFGFFKPMSIVTGVLATALAACDRWLWRIPGLSFLHGVPDLNGTWRGEIHSIRKDDDGQPRAPIPIALVIRQSYTSLSVSLFTAESSSVSIAAGLSTEADGRTVVSYLYRSEPKLSAQDRSRVHHGGVKLTLIGDGDILDGAYWTDRDSKGEIRVKQVSRWSHALDLESARALSRVPAPGQETKPPGRLRWRGMRRTGGP